MLRDWAEDGVFMVSRRRDDRITATLPVRVWGMDASGKPFSLSVKTCDVTRTGVRLMGVTVQLAPDEIVGIQYGEAKARYRVVWCGKPGTRNAGQVGLQTLQPEKQLWKEVLAQHPSPVPVLVDLHGESIDSNPQTASAAAISTSTDPEPEEPGERVPGAERRIATRYPCHGSAQLINCRTSQRLLGTVSDLSLTGCHVFTVGLMVSGTQIEIFLNVKNTELRCVGEVRSSNAASGMGIQFLTMSVDDRQRLTQLLKKLARMPKITSSVSVSDRVQFISENTIQDKSAGISGAVYRLSTELRELENEMGSSESGIDPRLLIRLRASMENAKQSAYAVQQWIECRDQHKDPTAVLNSMETAWLRMCASVLRDLLADMDRPNFNFKREGLAEVYTAALNLYKRLAWIAEQRKNAKAAT